MWILLVVFCLLAGFSAAVAESVGRKAEGGLLKMLAATAYVVFALHMGATGSRYGQLVLVALTLSWFGDLFLLGSGRFFLAGLGSFLLAHVAYAAAFFVRGVTATPTLVGAAVMAVVGVLVMRWLLEARFPASYGAPVAVYTAGIGVMVAMALGTAWSGLVVGNGPAATGRAILVGAGLFAVSDILVARHRFVRAEAWNRLVGLPVYLAAQLLLASSI